MLGEIANACTATVPTGWEIVEIQSIGQILGGGTPSRNTAMFWNGSIPWVTPTDVTHLHTKQISQTREYITERGLASSAAKILPAGALLMTTRATIGSVAMAGVALCTNQGFKSLIPNPTADPNFYYYVFQTLTPQLLRLGSGSTFLEVPGREFARVLVARPPLPEQRRIAHILDTADAAIQQTEALIAKLKLTRTGLLRDLLTHGLDERGELRDPVVHMKQFQETPLGLIPREWKVATLASTAESITSGSRGWAAYYSDDGPLFLRIGNLTREHINLRLTDLVHVHPPTGGEGTRTAVRPGDVLISITADLGIIGVIPEHFDEAYVNQHIALIRLASGGPEPRWIGHYLSSPVGQRQFYRLNDAGAKAGLNLPTVGALLVAFPPLPEQAQIVNIIDAHDARIRAEEAYRDKLIQLKQGLMDDLLTGRVRVPVAEEAVV